MRRGFLPAAQGAASRGPPKLYRSQNRTVAPIRPTIGRMRARSAVRNGPAANAITALHSDAGLANGNDFLTRKVIRALTEVCVCAGWRCTSTGAVNPLFRVDGVRAGLSRCITGELAVRASERRNPLELVHDADPGSALHRAGFQCRLPGNEPSWGNELWGARISNTGSFATETEDDRKSNDSGKRHCGANDRPPGSPVGRRMLRFRA